MRHSSVVLKHRMRRFKAPLGLPTEPHMLSGRNQTKMWRVDAGDGGGVLMFVSNAT